MTGTRVAGFGVAIAAHAALLLLPIAAFENRDSLRTPKPIRLELTLLAPTPAAAPVVAPSAPPNPPPRPSPPLRSAPKHKAPREAPPAPKLPDTVGLVELAPEPTRGAPATPGPAGSPEEETLPGAGYQVVSEPSYLARAEPEHPAVARRLRQEGTVVLRLFIDAEGTLDRIEVAKSSGFASLDRAAIEAEKRSRFRPARVGGRAVPCQAEIPYRFDLD